MAETIAIGRRRIEVSNLEKVFYPETGFTKGEVIDYYRSVSEALVPHLRYRPVTLKRYPNGVEGPFFYEKSCPKHRPEWVKTVALRRKQDGKDVHYCQLNGEAALVWAANLADLELHVSLATARSTRRPKAVVFDLDPGEGTGVIECADIALRLRDIFAALELECFVKTSGSKGLQLYVPLNSRVRYDDTKPWAQAVARHLEAEAPDEIVSKPSKEARRGKVFVDWSQNDFHKTTVCVYSLRAKQTPIASTPLEWDEVERALERSSAESLTFTSDEVLKRIEVHGDLFAPVLELEQKLPELDLEG
ncbi:MAG: non-homologous end-joining DNA ligase [Actinomycetota bacterium]